MIQIKFKNLESSELAKEAALSRISPLIEKFPDLVKSRILVTLEMHNSPNQPGPDLFSVKIHCQSGRYRELTIEKSATNLYWAIADVTEHMLERLNRFGDRERVSQRGKIRRFLKSSHVNLSDPQEQ